MNLFAIQHRTSNMQVERARVIYDNAYKLLQKRIFILDWRMLFKYFLFLVCMLSYSLYKLQVFAISLLPLSTIHRHRSRPYHLHRHQPHRHHQSRRYA